LSNLEKQLNTIVLIILLIQVILALAVGLVSNWWKKFDTITQYVPMDYPRMTDSALKCIIYFLLLNTLLPISLMVTLEIIKVVEA